MTDTERLPHDLPDDSVEFEPEPASDRPAEPGATAGMPSAAEPVTQETEHDGARSEWARPVTPPRLPEPEPAAPLVAPHPPVAPPRPAPVFATPPPPPDAEPPSQPTAAPPPPPQPDSALLPAASPPPMPEPGPAAVFATSPPPPEPGPPSQPTAAPPAASEPDAASQPAAPPPPTPEPRPAPVFAWPPPEPESVTAASAEIDRLRLEIAHRDQLLLSARERRVGLEREIGRLERQLDTAIEAQREAATERAELRRLLGNAQLQVQSLIQLPPPADEAGAAEDSEPAEPAAGGAVARPRVRRTAESIVYAQSADDTEPPSDEASSERAQRRAPAQRRGLVEDARDVLSNLRRLF